MIRTAFTVASAAMIAFATSASAAERPLKGAEIDALIKGNTVTGQDVSGVWRQFFDTNGDTVYAGGSKPPSRGAWSVQADKFCSKWPPGDGWTCYLVTGDLDAKPPTVTWISESGTKYPGTVRSGNGL